MHKGVFAVRVVAFALPLFAAVPAGAQYPRGPYGGPYGRPVYDELTSAVRIDVTPRDAEVFVDGRPAGLVDDYDGIFQRLRLRPGEHEIVLYLAGYRTVHETVTLRRNQSHKIELKMARLGSGETPEPRPVPVDRPDRPEPATEPRDPRMPNRPTPEDFARTNQNFGSLSLRVLPIDAEILVDGERWMMPEGQDRLRVQLAPGRHRVEVRKAGFEAFSTSIDIRRGETNTLNVSLLRGSF